MQNASSARVNQKAIPNVARMIASGDYARPVVEQDQPFIGESVEQAATWCFLLDSLNFCFWAVDEEQKWRVQDAGGRWREGYWALVAALLRGIGQDRGWLDPQRMRHASRKDVERLLAGQGEIPLLQERHRAVIELGGGLAGRDGAWKFVSGAEGDVLEFVDHVISTLPGFRDEAEYHGRPVGLYKRAQILAQDLSLVLQAWDQVPFGNLEALTAFADYKIPQLLRDEQVLVYDAGLAEKVDSLTELSAGSPEEIEIRAAMIEAIELVNQELLKQGITMTSAQIDNILWTEAKQRGDSMKPHHRTRTIYY